jgi:hypothetical protein
MTEASDEAPQAPAPQRRSRVVPWLVVLVVLVGLGAAAYVLARPTEHRAAMPPGDSPVHATKQSFCTAYARLVGIDDGRSVRDWADALAKVGTPESVPDDARTGFELVLAHAAEVDEGASAGKLAKKQGHLNDADTRSVEAFTEYATTTCTREIEAAVQNAAGS